jgi:hypothetical protein
VLCLNRSADGSGSLLEKLSAIELGFVFHLRSFSAVTPGNRVQTAFKSLKGRIRKPADENDSGS